MSHERLALAWLQTVNPVVPLTQIARPMLLESATPAY